MADRFADPKAQFAARMTDPKLPHRLGPLPRHPVIEAVSRTAKTARMGSPRSSLKSAGQLEPVEPKPRQFQNPDHRPPLSCWKNLEARRHFVSRHPRAARPQTSSSYQKHF
jgi:hypothetical protein